VSVCEALNTIRPTVPASHGLPLPRALLRDLPADWWICGQNVAHDTRCAAVGNRAMSTPISVGEREGNEPYGVDWTKPVARFDEALATIRALWDSRGELVNRDSPYFPLRNAVRI